jgi:hypothetical protein
MTFINVFKVAISHWPDLIDFNDGMLFPENGFRSERLYNIWTSIEDTIISLYPNNIEFDIMTGSIYQVVHRYALANFNKGVFTLKISEIPLLEFEIQYKKNINKS